MLMKYSITKIAILFFLQFTIAFAQDCKSTLVITTTNSNSAIIVGNSLTAKGSGSFILPKGKYNILIKESAEKWDGFEIEDSITIDECGKSYSRNYEIGKMIFIDSTPQNAEVRFENSIIGYTPAFVNDYKIPSIKIVKGDKQIQLSNQLEYVKPIDLGIAPIKNGKAFIETPLFKWLLGSAFILGGTSAYLKIKADQRYDDYKLSKNKATYDEVKQLDLYSAVALGFLEINFGYLIYRFLTE